MANKTTSNVQRTKKKKERDVEQGAAGDSDKENMHM